MEARYSRRLAGSEPGIIPRLSELWRLKRVQSLRERANDALSPAKNEFFLQGRIERASYSPEC